MWPSIKHWLDSVIHDALAPRRLAQAQTIHYAWERAGHVCAGEGRPIAWCAESVSVETVVRLPASLGRDRTDFSIRVGQAAVVAEQMRCVEGDRFRVYFRVPPPPRSCVAELLFRDRVMARVELPVISRSEFLTQVSADLPTVYVRLGAEAVACATFVSTQCKGLLASVMLNSTAGLLPFLDVDLEVEFRCDRSGATQRLPVRLTSSQLQSKSALVTVAPPKHPRRQGTWTVTWFVGGREAARRQIRAISRKAFERSLRLSDCRFAIQPLDGPFRLSRQVPTSAEKGRIGPCFLVSSSEPGMAGLCRLEVVANIAGAVRPPLLLEQEVLVTDGPAMVAPGTLEWSELAQVSGFELKSSSGVLGLLPLSPVPTATFTGEGGFTAQPDYPWSAAAEDEMQDRLKRLLGG